MIFNRAILWSAGRLGDRIFLSRSALDLESNAIGEKRAIEFPYFLTALGTNSGNRIVLSIGVITLWTSKSVLRQLDVDSIVVLGLTGCVKGSPKKA